MSYFRGRKFHGRLLKIPVGYKGIVISSTDQKLPKTPQILGDKEELDEDEQLEDVGILEGQAEFDEVMVWDHEALPDASTDTYVRGVEEWIAFAEQVGYDACFQRSTDSLRYTRTLHGLVKFPRNPGKPDRTIVVPESIVRS